MNMRLLCLPVKYEIKNLKRRAGVPAEVYEEGELEHPVIPGLMLSLEERLYGGCLEIWEAETAGEVRDETLGEVRDETLKEKSWRVQWKKPIARSESRTEKDHVPLNMELFKKKKKEKTKIFYYFYQVNELKEKAAKAYRELEEAQHVAAIMVVEEAPAQCAVAEEIQEMPAKVQSAADVQEKSNPRLGWLERQLANVVAQLMTIMTDIESGSSISDLGFSCDEDFQKMIEDMGNVIAKLKSMIQTLKEVGVGVER